MTTPTKAQYERDVIRRFQSELREIEKAPLYERKKAVDKWKGSLKTEPEAIAERVGWLLDGSYGEGAYIRAREIARSPRMNRPAALSQMVAAMEWRTPGPMARKAFLNLPKAEQQKINKLIQGRIDEFLEENENPIKKRSQTKKQTGGGLLAFLILGGATIWLINRNQ